MNKRKVLLIEDDPDILETTEEILELADYEVYTAENGKIGIESAKDLLPDIIICDIMMPEIDGYGVLKVLSKNPKTSTIPFVFLTAKVEKEDIREGMSLGADDYLTKPFMGNDLLDTIDIRLKKSQNVRKYITENDEPAALFGGAHGLEPLISLSVKSRKKKYKRKEELYREGDLTNYLYFIISGKVKSFKVDDYGKELVCDIYNENDYIGYLTILEDGDYTETATAMEDTEVSLIPKDDFKELLKTDRDFTSNFIKKLAKNVLENEKRLLKLAYTPVRERVAEALVDVLEKYTNDSSNLLNFTREDLANIVGTAKESLVRTLSEFKKEGLIDIIGRNIRIEDLEGLKSVYK